MSPASDCGKRLQAGAACVMLLLLPGLVAHAGPTSAAQAEAAVQGWLSLEAEPLETAMGRQVGEVRSYPHAEGGTSYHVVYLEPAGFVIVAGDDLVGPVIAFAPAGRYDLSDDNPLGALVARDLACRVTAARAREALRGPKARRRWRTLERVARGAGDTISRLRGKGAISQVHVAPIVKSTWAQTTVGGQTCYNFYTPRNYPCGAVATAMAQLMRYYGHPTKKMGNKKFGIYVNGVKKQRRLLGGEYQWKRMVMRPDASIKKRQRKAIGTLCHDAGVAAHTRYAAKESKATISNAKTALVRTFGYGNAIRSGTEVERKARSRMLNANLAARRPCIMGIQKTGGRHAVVVDGYGYHSGKLYHHLNMGRAGVGDVWYELPNVRSYDTVGSVIYNVFQSGEGEIVSGRVTDKKGKPVGNVKVTIERTGGWSRKTKTSGRGIYAFDRLRSDARYTVGAEKTGYKFVSETMVTGTSGNNSNNCGNRWQVDIREKQKPDLVAVKAYPADSRGRDISDTLEVGQAFWPCFRFECQGADTGTFRLELRHDEQVRAGYMTARAGRTYKILWPGAIAAKSGQHRIAGRVDVDNDIVERKEDNNRVSGRYTPQPASAVHPSGGPSALPRLLLSAEDQSGTLISGVALAAAQGEDESVAILTGPEPVACRYSRGALVTLSAPGSVTDGGRLLVFDHWNLAGEPTAHCRAVLEVRMEGDLSAVAVYGDAEP